VQLTALVESPEHVCCRYRVEAFRPFLEPAGCRLEVRPLPGHWWSWLGLRHQLRGADVVLLQRKLLQSWQLQLLRRAARVLLFDFDDAVFLRDSYSPKGLHSAARGRRFAALAAAADGLVAGNTFLRDYAVRCAKARQVHVIPTCVAPDRYPVADHVEPAGQVQLVWIGSSSTLRGLRALQPLLEELGKREPRLAFKQICDRFLPLRHLRTLECPWSEATEAVELAGAHIGISWLPDDLWSRGKCGLKVLQYMAAGLPVVANPVGVQAEMVRHGETGFLANSPDEWAEAILRLAHDPALRRQLGQAARRRVEGEYGVAVGGRQWLEVLGKVARRQAA